MIWCRFDDRGRPRYGLVDGDAVIPVAGSPLTRFRRLGKPRPLAGVKLLPPVMPGTFFCAGLNYQAHAERAAAGDYAHAVPTRPEVGYRANSALIGHGDPIVRPADYPAPLVAEGELVAVIGRPARYCSRAEAEAAVLGWTIGNDVSARVWQRSDRTFWRSKNSDTFKPMGPYLVTGADPLSATTPLRVDGAVTASFPTGDMIFDPFDYICAISRYITLRPGDVVWMGTDETADVVPGQAVEITIDGIGTLANPVIEEKLP